MELKSVVFLIILILVVVVALLIVLQLRNRKRLIVKVAGAGEYLLNHGGDNTSDIAEKTTGLMKNYVTEVGTSKHIEEHLMKYFNIDESDLKDYTPNRFVAKKLRRLNQILQYLEVDLDADSLDDFLWKLGIKYGHFLPQDKRNYVMSNILHRPQISAAQLKQVREKLDKVLRSRPKPLVLDTALLKKQALRIVKYYNILKLKPGYTKRKIDAIKKVGDLKPDRVFELDMLGLRPKIYEYAIITFHAKTTPRIKKDTLKQIIRDLEALRQVKGWPEVLYLEDISNVSDLSLRLRKLARMMREKRDWEKVREILKRESEKKEHTNELKRDVEELRREVQKEREELIALKEEAARKKAEDNESKDDDPKDHDPKGKEENDELEDNEIEDESKDHDPKDHDPKDHDPKEESVEEESVEEIAPTVPAEELEDHDPEDNDTEPEKVE